MSKHRGEPVYKYRVHFTESELGWGVTKWHTDYDTFGEAQDAITSTNMWLEKSNRTPEHYIIADNDIEEIQQ